MPSSSKPDSVVESPYRDRIITIPNIICGFRLVGAVLLCGLALTDNPHLFVGLFTVLNVSDWIDGKLARWLNQRSDFGARLDSLADSVLYGSLLFGCCWLRWEVMRSETPWWTVALLSYALTTSLGIWKYGKIPSYHTYGAKTSQWLTLAGAVCVLLDYSVWPLRVAMVAVTLTNLEAMIITWHLKEWRADVLTVFHLLPARRH